MTSADYKERFKLIIGKDGKKHCSNCNGTYIKYFSDGSGRYCADCRVFLDIEVQKISPLSEKITDINSTLENKCRITK